MNRPVLKIGTPYIESGKDSSRLCSVLELGGKPVYTLWYEVEKAFEPFLCCERVDGIVVNLLLYAMEHGYDLESDCEMSEQIRYQLTEYLIPSIAKNIKRYQNIELRIPVSLVEIANASAVGASLSGGVDSFYTLFQHLHRSEERYNITHLCFFNAGASGAGGGEKGRARYHARIRWIKSVADDLGKELVCVDTNVNEFLHQRHEATHTFRTLAIPLILQKLFSKYFFASGVELKDFNFSEADTADYDLLITQCISSENLKFYVSGGEASRLEKLRRISSEDLTYNKLNVCEAEDTNCGRCDKCVRTMVELYALGCLENYNGVFDTSYFKKHKSFYFARMLAFKNCKDRYGGYDWNDVYKVLRHEVTLFDRIYGVVYKTYRMTRHRLYSVAWIRKLYLRAAEQVDRQNKDKKSPGVVR